MQSVPSRLMKNAVLFQHTTLIIGLVCVGIGQTLLYTILGPASRKIGLSEVEVGTIVTLAALLITFSSGVWGGIIGRIGSKKSYIIGMACYTLGSFILAMVIGVSIQKILSISVSFFAILFLRCITGILTSGIHPAAMTYISETTNREKRGSAIALISSAYGIGSILGPMLGSFLGGVSILLPLYIAGIISLIGTILGAFVLENKDTPKEKKSDIFKKIKIFDSRTMPILIGIALTYVSFSAFQQTISFYIQDKFGLDPKESIINTGYAVSIMALSMVITQLVLIQLLKPKAKSLLIAGFMFCSLGFFLLSFFSSALTFTFAGSGSLGVGFGMMIPAIQSSASLAVDEDEQGGVAGFLFGASAFGYVIGPLLGTYIYSIKSEFLFYFCIIISLVSALSTMKVVLKKQ